MSEQVQCLNCKGTGKIALGEHFVSHEMALDACEPEMEGMSMGIEYGKCPECAGDGWIEQCGDLHVVIKGRCACGLVDAGTTR